MANPPPETPPPPPDTSPPESPEDDAASADNPSLKNEPSQQAYNEPKARDAFGDAFIDKLKLDQKKFRGDWWQLAFLFKNLEKDKNTPTSNPKTDSRSGTSGGRSKR